MRQHKPTGHPYTSGLGTRFVKGGLRSAHSQLLYLCSGMSIAIAIDFTCILEDRQSTPKPSCTACGLVAGVNGTPMALKINGRPFIFWSKPLRLLQFSLFSTFLSNPQHHAGFSSSHSSQMLLLHRLLAQPRVLPHVQAWFQDSELKHARC